MTQTFDTPAPISAVLDIPRGPGPGRRRRAARRRQDPDHLAGHRGPRPGRGVPQGAGRADRIGVLRRPTEPVCGLDVGSWNQSIIRGDYFVDSFRRPGRVQMQIFRRCRVRFGPTGVS